MLKYRFSWIQRVILFQACLLALLLTALIWHGSGALRDYYAYASVYKTPMKNHDRRWQLFRFFIQKRFSQSWKEVSFSEPAETSPIETLHIAIDRKYIEKLNSNLPQSGREKYYPGYMRVGNNGNRTAIKLRYRGDNAYHWLYEKKSLRIKMKKGRLYRGYRKFNLINPKNIMNMQECITHELSKIAGVLAPACSFVRVLVNGEYMGVYHFLSQIEESLLRNSRRMPGSVYSGDVFGKRAFNPDPHRAGQMLWDNQEFWAKKAARNAEQKNNREDIKLFVERSGSDDPAVFRAFYNKHMNKDKWLSYIALEVILGGAHHTYFHNQKIYFDPYLGRFEPIQWDFFLWNTETAQKFKYGSPTKILHQLMLHPDVTEDLNKKIYDLLNRPEFSRKTVFTRLDLMYGRTKDALASDKFKDTMIWENPRSPAPSLISAYYNMDDYYNAIVAFKIKYAQLNVGARGLLDDAVGAFVSAKGNGYQILDIVSAGSVGIKLDTKEFGPSNIFRDSNQNGVWDPNDVRVSAKISELLLPGRLLVPDKKRPIYLGGVRIVSHPLIYRYFIVDNNVSIPDQLKATNNITGADVIIKRDQKAFEKAMKLVKAAKGKTSLHPWKLPKMPMPREVVFSGDVFVDKDIDIEKSATVRIEPGTRFLMGYGVSILIRGKVQAMGTKQAPIEVIPKTKGVPWGSFVIRDEGANGSRLKYFYVRGGSTMTKDLIYYSGMFAIHNVKDISVDYCKIGKNFVGDDAMHFAYSTGVISNCIFMDARSDALDVDISEVTIRNSLFYQAGNDALDFMTSSPLVHDNIFFSSGDKCISVGEATNAKIKNNLFYNCEIAIQVKDDSRVDLERTVIVGARAKALDLYNKNYRYARGGTIHSSRVYIPAGISTVTSDKKSTAEVQEVVSNYPNDYSMTILGKKYLIDPQGKWRKEIVNLMSAKPPLQNVH